MDGQSTSDMPTDKKPEPTPQENVDVTPEVVGKISEAQNILIALSSDPSVDELCAAIGLSLYLDKLGKHATAIYSGATPNALEFLKPEETFEPTIDALQDFVIALNKEKADHLRYKLDGDYVKIFITPYKTRISEDDLDYSYGDFNIDLVLALNVANGIDLDSALREHGRIMHDAVIINVSTGNPGKFGEIEWNDKTASSISEMIAKMLFSTDGKEKLEKDEATAFLTGIIAATDRFSNAKTASSTMVVSSKLMEAGADQQLITKNITDAENSLYTMLGKTPAEESTDPTSLDIAHEDGSDEEEPLKDSPKEESATEALSEAPTEAPVETPVEAPAEIPQSEPASEPVAPPAIPTPEPTTEPSPEPTPEPISSPDPDLLDDLKAAEESLSYAGAETTPESTDGPIQIDSTTSDPELISDKAEKILQPSGELVSETTVDDANKYGQMLEDALADAGPIEQPAPLTSPQDEPLMSQTNPAIANTPVTASSPEINGVPEINYMPMPGEEVLPPPPTPPISDDIPEITPPVTPAPSPADTTPVNQNTPSTDSFKIPGM